VEDYANKFQSLVAEIVAMPPSEGDLLQKFRNELKPEMHIAAGIDPVIGTRWMNLQSFISFACATDASRAQANKGKQASDKSEQGKSSGSETSYKDKLKGKRLNESSNGQPSRSLRRARISRSQLIRRLRPGSITLTSTAISLVTRQKTALISPRGGIFTSPSKGM
jgi:hypothetical protein